jgi:hypothetical protein
MMMTRQTVPATGATGGYAVDSLTKLDIFDPRHGSQGRGPRGEASRRMR